MGSTAYDIECLAMDFNGHMVVSVRDEIWNEAKEDFKKAMVIKLSTGKSFNLKAMATVLKRAWNTQAVTFQEVKFNMAVVKFGEENHLIRVLDSGPWYFNGAAILTKRWIEGLTPEELEFEGLKLWIQIHNLPIELMKKKTVKGFAELAGKICKEPPDEEEVIRGPYARFQIEASIYKHLFKGCYLKNQQGQLIWIEYKYEKIPSLCSKCRSISHRGDSCESDKEKIQKKNHEDHETQSDKGERFTQLTTLNVYKELDKEKLLALGEQSMDGRNKGPKVSQNIKDSLADGQPMEVQICWSSDKGRETLIGRTEAFNEMGIGEEVLNLEALTDAKWEKNIQVEECDKLRSLVVGQVDYTDWYNQQPRARKGKGKNWETSSEHSNEFSHDHDNRFHPYRYSKKAKTGKGIQILEGSNNDVSAKAVEQSRREP